MAGLSCPRLTVLEAGLPVGAGTDIGRAGHFGADAALIVGQALERDAQRVVAIAAVVAQQHGRAAVLCDEQVGIAVAVLGYLMASRLPMPKVGMTKSKLVSAFLLILIIIAINTLVNKLTGASFDKGIGG